MDKPLARHLGGQYLKLYLSASNLWLECSITNLWDNSGRLILHLRHHPDLPLVNELLSQLQESPFITASGPFGSAVLSEIEGPVLFIAGGTGMAHIYALLQSLPIGPHPCYLYWGVRKSVDLYLSEKISAWLKAHPNALYHPILSGDSLHWEGRTGLVHEAIEEDFSALTEFTVFASGPYPMVTATLAALSKKGLPRQQFFTDMLPD